jgi:hypothetical protein
MRVAKTQAEITSNIEQSFPSFLDEDSDSGNDSLPQAFEFSGRI